MKGLNFRTLLVVALVAVVALSTFGMAYATTPSGDNATTLQQAQAPGFRDIGPLPSNYVIPFEIYVPLKNMGLLASEAAAISTPGSPMFDHFLTVSQIENRFTNEQLYGDVLSTITAEGFNVELTAMNSVILASGTAGQIRNDLGINVDVFSNGSYSYYSSYGTPLIPGVSILASNYTSSLFAHPSTLVAPSLLQKERSMAEQINQTFSIQAFPATSLQSVYNESGILSKGTMGQNATIGILDFYGNPYIKGELQYYDQLFGLPAPPSFKIVPIGPYDPNMGIVSGWDVEISLDVESSHTMAPLANITLYIANGNIPFLGPIIATIDSLHQVTSLSQSFSIPESLMANMPAADFVGNVIQSDVFYEMGALEGITFIASTGDAGGSGYSAGPLGTPGYPSTSPFVSALGGTETYIDYAQNGSVMSAMQTAWSNYGFVPYNVNYGGGTGGVSMMEPLPFYQSSLATKIPASFPHGRLVPDISLNAGVFPGIYIVYGQNLTSLSGGTSESSPLFAGMVALAASVLHHPLGLVNPELYALGSSSVSSKVFYPITFGYITPWQVSPGYNLVTGLGSLNLGAFLYFYSGASSSSTLNITVSETAKMSNTTYYPEIPDGQDMTISATITLNGTAVTTGNFSASVSSLSGTSTVPLVYNSTVKEWVGLYHVSNGTQGIGDIKVSGSSQGVMGSGYSNVFFGYYAFTDLPSMLPYALEYGLPLQGFVTWLNGTNAFTNISVSVSQYSILSNEYVPVSTKAAQVTDGAFAIMLPEISTPGVTLVSTGNAYLFLPFYNGVLLQESQILGPVVSEPGAVAPGQDIFVEGILVAPYFAPYASPYTPTNVQLGSNLTFSLVNQHGTILSTVFATPGSLAQLPVPSNISSGLYTIFINSTYNSYAQASAGLYPYINGSFFGQIWVSSDISVPSISITPSVVLEGQMVNISATITENGKPVQYGTYTASIYPADLSVEYYTITLFNFLYLSAIPLFYNATSGTWQGYAMMPSGNSSGSIYFENGLTSWAGPYYAYVTGESWDGVLTTTSPSSQYYFQVRSPLITSLQSDVSNLTEENSLLQAKLSSLNQSLTGEISSLTTELSTANGQISSLKSNIATNNATISSQHEKIKNLESQVSLDQALAIVGLIGFIIAIAALAIALVRKPKS
ncbi:MAG: protease pro-enzyme activation domain-containing protein [Thermoplasmata archaeon]